MKSKVYLVGIVGLQKPMRMQVASHHFDETFYYLRDSKGENLAIIPLAQLSYLIVDGAISSASAEAEA